MSQLSLFNDDPPPQAARLAAKLHALAERGVYLGTSSWKYEGWLGEIYSPERYITRGKFSQAKFDAECLKEYAQTFPAVCGDFSFYQFPTTAYWTKLFGGTPDSLRFAFKVPEEITVANWPSHARYGARAGQENKGFLDPRLFETAFAQPLGPYRDRVAAMIFEFGTFPKRVFPDPGQFFARLDAFLGALPEGFRYSVEIRNPEYLGPDYFATLASYNVAHVFNAWTRMPEIADQVALPGAFTADFVVARALLRRGRNYEDAVAGLSPYKEIQEPNERVRDALRYLINRALRLRKAAFLFVNNRLEGNAPGTIEAVVSGMEV
ncbi:MAG: hypothetical protein JWN86_1978 [Planctomycetota bacterium]|nr:hypothetical protein [Planctomycetota bacterium]